MDSVVRPLPGTRSSAELMNTTPYSGDAADEASSFLTAWLWEVEAIASIASNVTVSRIASRRTMEAGRGWWRDMSLISITSHRLLPARVVYHGPRTSPIWP